MNIVPAIGAMSLGAVIGWMVRYFIRRFKSFTPKALGAVVSIIAGGAVVKYLGQDPSAVWFYPIGLLLGFVLYTITVLLTSRQQGSGADTRDQQEDKDRNKGGGKSPYDGPLFGPPPRL